MKELSDKVLVKQAKENNFKAFEELVNRYETKVYNLAYKILGSQEDAKDILQDTFLSAFKSIDKFKEKSNFSTWIYRIATNACLMKFRKKEPKMVSLDDRLFATGKEAIDWSKNPLTLLEEEELKKVMNQAIKSLPPSHRAVFVLRDIEKLSNLQTAKALGISVSAVKSRLHRARLCLREKLSGYFKGEYHEM